MQRRLSLILLGLIGACAAIGVLLVAINLQLGMFAPAFFDKRHAYLIGPMASIQLARIMREGWQM